MDVGRDVETKASRTGLPDMDAYLILSLSTSTFPVLYSSSSIPLAVSWMVDPRPVVLGFIIITCLGRAWWLIQFY